MRGNVVDLAIGVVIGAAFTSIVNSLVTDIIMPIVAAIMRQPDFSHLAVTINGSNIMYGRFLSAALTFLIVALVVYYFVVLPINKLMIRAGRRAALRVDSNEKTEEQSYQERN